MTTKLTIEADVATLNQQITDIKQKLAEVNSSTKGGVYKLDTQQAEQDVKRLTAAFDRLERIREKVMNNSGLSFKAASTLSQLYNRSASAIERVNQTAGAAYSPTDPGWMRTAAIENDQFLQDARDNNASAVFSTRRSRSYEQEQGINSRFQSITRFGAQVAGAAIGGGGIGSIIGAGVGAFAGPAGAIIGGAIGGKLDSGTSDASKEAIDYHNLRNNLGNSSVDFDNLRNSVRYLTEGLGVTYNEAEQLAQSFARTAASAPDVSLLSKSLQDAIGFSRGYGIDQQAGTEFFAGQQLNKVTGNESDNKRLATQIAEATARSGTSSKMTEMLAVITQFTQRTAAQSLAIPDVSAFTSLMGTLMSSNTPGLSKNPMGSAGLIEQADEGMRHMSSEAQKNFMMTALQRTYPKEYAAYAGLDLNARLEGGAFATGASTFGPDTDRYKFAVAQGDWDTVARYDALNKDTTRNIQIERDEVLRASRNADGGINTAMAAKNFAGLNPGMSEDQASALLNKMSEDKGLGQLESQLKRYGLDKVGTAQLPAIASLLIGDDKDFNDQYTHLIDTKKVADKDKIRIDKLNPNSDEFRKEILALTMRNAGDEGDKSRDVAASAANISLEISGKLIPYTLVMKDTLIEILRESAKSDAAKAFVAEQDMIKVGAQKGIDLSGKRTTPKDMDGQTFSLPLSGKNFKGQDLFMPYRYQSVTDSLIDDVAEHLFGESKISGAEAKAYIERKKGVIKNDTGYDQSVADFLEFAGDNLDNLDAIKAKLTPKSLSGSKATISPFEAYKQDIGPNQPASRLPASVPGLGAKQSDFYQKTLNAKQRENADLIIAESEKQGRPERTDFVLGMAQTESSLGLTSGNLFQFMDGTARGLGFDPNNKAANIKYGVSELNRLYDKFGSADLAAGAWITGEHWDEYKQGLFPSDNIQDSKDINARIHAAKVKRYTQLFSGFTPNTGKINNGVGDVANPSLGPRRDIAEGFISEIDKIPRQAYEKSKERERDKISIKHHPLSLDITLRDPGGNPLTDRVVSSHFGSPRPSGTG